MKGKMIRLDKPVTRAYAGGDSNVAREAHSDKEDFRRGGKVDKRHRAERKHGGKIHGEEAMKHAGRKARKDGGRLLSSAAASTPRKAAEHY